MANIYDVAKMAGVSKSTVSLVLNNRQTVKPATRKAVEDAIRALNYVPNNSARCLMNRKTNSLAVVILTDGQMMRDYSFDEPVLLDIYNISDGICKVLEDTDYSIATEYYNIHSTGLPRLIERKRVDGVFVTGSFYDGEAVRRIQEADLPTIAVGTGRDTGCRYSVIADPQEGFRLGVEKLIATGHRHICCLNSVNWFLSSKDRTKGALQAAQEAGIDLEERDILYTDRNIGESAYEVFGAYWETGNRPDGIMAANNTVAYGAIRYLHEHHVQIPQDISIIVYDDSPLCGYPSPALSAINIQKEKMGQLAAQMMLKCLSGKQEMQMLTVPSYYVERNSVRTRWE